MKLSLEEFGSQKVFKRQDSSKDDIAASGEVFYLKLYGATAKTLDRQIYLMYLKSIKGSSLKTEFSLESLPPTSAAAKHHSYRVYHTVQQSEGNTLSPIYSSWVAHNNHDRNTSSS